MNFQVPANFLILGKTNTGKTQSFKYIVRNCLCKKLNKIYVFCWTMRYSNDYDYIPDDYKFDSFDKNEIENILERAKISKKNL